MDTLTSKDKHHHENSENSAAASPANLQHPATANASCNGLLRSALPLAATRCSSRLALGQWRALRCGRALRGPLGPALGCARLGCFSASSGASPSPGPSTSARRCAHIRPASTLALLDKKSDRAVQRLHTREPKFGHTETLHEILHDPNMRMCVLESSGPSALSTLKTVRSSYTASTEQH